MKIKNLPKCQIIEMSLSLILPVFMIVLGIKFEIDNLIIDFISILLFLILPLVFSFFICLLFKSSINDLLKPLCTILLLFFLVILWFVITIFSEDEYLRKISPVNINSESLYSEHFSNIQPPLTDVVDRPDEEYAFWYSHRFSLFSNSIIYHVYQYSNEEYERQVNKMNQSYIFEDESDNSHNVKESQIYGGVIDSYKFRLLSTEAYALYHPEEMVFIITNDELKQIIIMMFYELSYPGDNSLEDFLIGDCGWEHVSKRIAQE